MNTILPYYHRHTKIIQGKGALHTLNDLLISYNCKAPLFIITDTPNMVKKATSRFQSHTVHPFTYYIERETIDFSPFDSIIVYGGKEEIVLGDYIYKKFPFRVPMIHIPFGTLNGDEYTHYAGTSDIIIFDEDLCSHLTPSQIGSIMSVMLFYLFSSALEAPNVFIRPSLMYVLSIASSIIEEKQEIASFKTTTLIPFIGEIASNVESSLLISLMEKLEIPSFCTLSQVCETLLLPLVAFIKQTNSTLYSTIENSLKNRSVESFCSYWIELSPLEGLDTILQHLISNMYQLLESKEKNSILHRFLCSLKEGKS